MHRAYQPLVPTTNRYLQEKWDKATYQGHRRKVQTAVPVVNTATLPTPFHLQVNLKKKQLERDRQAIQQRENLLHSSRLHSIKQSQGGLDNWNFYCPRSLNGEKRQRDLCLIGWENLQLLKRLEGRRSDLAQEHWRRRWQQQELFRNNITRYPCGQVGKGSPSQVNLALPERPGTSASKGHGPLGGRRGQEARFQAGRSDSSPEQGLAATPSWARAARRKPEAKGPAVKTTGCSHDGARGHFPRGNWGAFAQGRFSQRGSPKKAPWEAAEFKNLRGALLEQATAHLAHQPLSHGGPPLAPKRPQAEGPVHIVKSFLLEDGPQAP